MVKKTFLITGNCGYVGSVLTEECLKNNHQVIGYDILMHGKEHLNHLEKNPNLKIINGDIRDLNKIEPLIKESDILVHLAAIARVDNCINLEKEMEDINTNSSISIASLCDKYNKKFIFASSCSVYGLMDNNKEVEENSPLLPTTIYARTKLAAEKGILNINKKAIILRFATAYGQSPRMRYDLFINEIIRDAYIKKKIDLFDPNVWRCYIHIKDMSKAILFFSKKEKIEGNIFNIGSREQNLTKEKIIDVMEKIIGYFEINLIRDKKDPRDYIINFNRAYLEGFKVDKNIEFGIKEMLDNLIKKEIDPYDIKFTNYK